MKCIRYHEHGGPSVLKYEDCDEPVPKDNEVKIRVKAASVNHLDIWLRKGLPGIKIKLPRIPGADASGVIESVGRNVSNFKKGDRVLINPSICCGNCEFCSQGDGSLCLSYSIFGEHQNGTYCDFICIDEHNAVKIPDSLGFEIAAAAPLAYLTAWRMMVTKLNIKPSETVLIFSAGAGVGVACIQIAKLIGATVIATSSGNTKLDTLRQLGADHVINHSEEDVVKTIKRLTNRRGVDYVVDYIGKETWLKGLYSLKRGGAIVTCGATSGYNPNEDLRHVFYRQLKIYGSTMGSNKEFYDVIKLVMNGKLKPHIFRTLPMKDAAKAHELIQSRSVVGKIVLVN